MLIPYIIFSAVESEKEIPAVFLFGEIIGQLVITRPEESRRETF
jgi:hypothetical protein